MPKVRAIQAMRNRAERYLVRWLIPNYLMVIRYKALSNAIVYRYKLSNLVRKNIGDSEMELIHTMKVRRGAQVSDVDGVRCRLADDTRVMSEASYTSIGNYNEISLINAYD